MNLQADTIADILIKHLKQKLSAEEQGILDAWLADSEANRQLFERLNDKKLFAAELDKLYSIDGSRENAWKKLCQALEQDEAMTAYTVPPLVSDPFPEVHRVHFLKTSWFRYAAAIVIVAGATVVAVLNSKQDEVATTNDHKHLQTDVAPGGDKAVLTLADGSKIILDNAQNGKLAQQGNTKVIKLDNGQLAYNAGNTLSKELLFNTISTPRGGQYQIVLPDGSKVWLNAASSIKFPTAFTGSGRDVEMTGEAYMEIAKNSKQPFMVRAKGTEVRVLGTSFNINAYSDEEVMKATLVEGSVQVSATTEHGQQTTVLKPGEQCSVISGRSSVVASADIDQALAWKNGLFSFKNADLPTVMRQLSKWYDVEVVYEGNVPERQFLGEMRRNMSLAAVLKVLERSNVHFSVEGKKIIVKP